ncbi:OmpA/MotB family protein [Halomonas nitroreducens]|uniref:Flagellar motor protein MotB n=1 Tax=Halomonas nitroreducens TaxID=447425 RepID=A0A431V906_9GAMM|nr:flagellar motor protein MotB [Halomonas nitroreducens]RTR07165.1 flagellar motor protein MotB [Halomonas nitroreducens]
MLEHRERPRHESLLPESREDESGQAWMVSYIDVMTLLVVLFVLVIALAEHHDASPPTPAAAAPARLGVPLPAALAQAREATASVPPSPGPVLAPPAVSAALGVAGLPAPSAAEPPALLARLPLELQADEPHLPLLPQLALPSGLDLAAPLADYMVILTDHLPTGVEAAPRATSEGLSLAAREVAEAVASAPYLPDLQGVEVTRVPEGVRLRVEDRLLFPTAQAELTEAGLALVAGRLGEVVARHRGEVAVQGHTDSRPIRTPRFPSNWALSSARAIAIVEALVRAGIAPSRLRAVGLADTRPLASNATAQGRARNRRVEVVIQTR